jgi:hypothetical protein
MRSNRRLADRQIGGEAELPDSLSSCGTTVAPEVEARESMFTPLCGASERIPEQTHRRSCRSRVDTYAKMSMVKEVTHWGKQACSRICHRFSWRLCILASRSPVCRMASTAIQQGFRRFSCARQLRRSRNPVTWCSIRSWVAARRWSRPARTVGRQLARTLTVLRFSFRGRRQRCFPKRNFYTCAYGRASSCPILIFINQRHRQGDGLSLVISVISPDD